MALWQRGKKGNWVYDFSVKGINYRGSFGPVNRTTAKNLYTQAKADALLGKLQTSKQRKAIKKNNPLFSDFCIEFLAWHKTQTRTATYNTTVSRIRTPLTPYFGLKRLSDITSNDIERFKSYRETQHIKHTTINVELTLLSQLFNKAALWGMIKDNPVKSIAHFKGIAEHLRYLSEDEEISMWENCSEDLKPLILLALHAGLRIGEITSLEWSEVDLINKRVLIPAHKSKSKKDRYIPMNQTLCTSLGEHKSKQIVSITHPTRVFEYEKEASIRYYFAKVRKQSGLVDFRFHDLRHTFASRLAMLGVPLRTIQELMGHQDISQTLRYAHLSPAYLQDTVMLLDSKIDAKGLDQKPHELHPTKFLSRMKRQNAN